jgi:hypothetical protein
MNERKLQHRSRIDAADEGTLERSVGPNFFNVPNNGLVGKPVTPNAAARSAAFALRANVGNVSSSTGSLGHIVRILEAASRFSPC